LLENALNSFIVRVINFIVKQFLVFLSVDCTAQSMGEDIGCRSISGWTPCSLLASRQTS